MFAFLYCLHIFRGTMPDPCSEGDTVYSDNIKGYRIVCVTLPHTIYLFLFSIFLLLYSFLTIFLIVVYLKTAVFT